MTSKGEWMATIQVLSEMERNLDELIANANLLRQCEEENRRLFRLRAKARKATQCPPQAEQ